MFFVAPINNKMLILYKNRNKITQNHPISIKLTVPSRQEFAIFKTPQFLSLGKSLIMAEVCDGTFFAEQNSHIRVKENGLYHLVRVRQKR